ncbi:MAG: cold shock domain-containing protein [Candidatus Moranbacteria bacterium]|nr:cold shock domain-containing protein [Candidatus Moranbacteria bacterium]
MAQGTIKRLTDRGFGFITQDGEDKDLFFHAKELQGVEFNDLKEGDRVQFEVSESPKGPNAINVSRV